MTEQNFIQTLKDAGICGGRVFPVTAVNQVHYPYAVYSIIRNTLTATVERSQGRRCRYMFTSFHETYADAVSTLELFSQVIGDNKLGYAVSGAIIDQDPDTLKWRLTNNDFSIIE